MSYLSRVAICFALLGSVLLLIHYNDFDLRFQSLFFDLNTKKWFIDKDDLFLKFWFYRFPKILLISYGVGLIIWGIKLKIYNQEIELQKKILFLILVLILTPLIVATFKHYSPIHCPASLIEFGGGREHISPIDLFNFDLFSQQPGKCFPAGHASGGFSLIALYFVMNTRRSKFISLLLALSMGWIMGLYQISKGAHYLSDTVVTLSIACLVSITLKEILQINVRPAKVITKV